MSGVTQVLRKGGLSAGGLYEGGLQAEKYGIYSRNKSCILKISLYSTIIFSVAEFFWQY